MKKVIFAWKEYMYQFDTYTEAHAYVRSQYAKYGCKIWIECHNDSGTEDPHVLKTYDGYEVTVRRRLDDKHATGW